MVAVVLEPGCRAAMKPGTNRRSTSGAGPAAEAGKGDPTSDILWQAYNADGHGDVEDAPAFFWVAFV